MKDFNLEVYKNEFKCRDDILKLFFDTLNPLEDSLTHGGSRMTTASFASGAPELVGGIEGFLRLLWGLSAAKELNADHPWWVRMREGVANGCDPNSDYYYGDIGDFDQRIVETAAIGYALVLNKDCFFDPLTKEEQKNIIAWIEQVNHAKAYQCNWMFFRVIVNIGLRYANLNYDKTAMEDYLDQLDEFYDSKGWYKDGDLEKAHADYYISFAMHFYGLFYAKYMGDVDPVRGKKYEDRARVFADDFIRWFASDGSGLPYGRSLTYRFAQVAFWGMYAMSENIEDKDLGVIKGIILRNFRWWHKQSIYDAKGRLTVGYAYEQQTMAENYNASGSVYWAMKSLIILAMDEDHPFWKAEEKALPIFSKPSLQKTSGLVIYNPNGSHTLAYNTGSKHTNGHTHVECKYEKFVYSSLFGFSTPKSHKNLEGGAFDSSLAVSEDGRWYRHKEWSSFTQIDEKRIITEWKPYNNVRIRTTLVLGHPWHVRIHDIKTDRVLELADGGFAISCEWIPNEKKEIELSQKDIYVRNDDRYSFIENVKGYDCSELVNTAANTNIMTPRAVLPMLKVKLGIGEHRLISFVSGDFISSQKVIKYDQVKQRVEERAGFKWQQ